MSTSEREEKIRKSNGKYLNLTIFEPEDTRAVVVIHPATSVTKKIYAKYAMSLVDEGLAVVTYDYSGVGSSAVKGDEKNSEIRMSDWMLDDIPSVNEYVRDKWPHLKLLAIGHSVGSHGQIAVQEDSPVDALAMVASHAGITSLIPDTREKVKVWSFFNLIVPITSTVFGRVPLKEIGMGLPTPVGVVKQWAMWNRTGKYFFADREFDFTRRYRSANIIVRSICFSDDVWSTREATRELTRRMDTADIEELDVPIGSDDTVGHMLFFKKENSRYWHNVNEWLSDQV